MKPRLLRKVKIFAAVFVVGIAITGGAAVWAGMAALGYVSNVAEKAMLSPTTTTAVENLREEAGKLSLAKPAECWNQAQTLLSVEPWLQSPLREILQDLGSACFQEKAKTCDGQSCT